MVPKKNGADPIKSLLTGSGLTIPTLPSSIDSTPIFGKSVKWVASTRSSTAITRWANSCINVPGKYKNAKINPEALWLLNNLKKSFDIPRAIYFEKM